MISRNSEKIVDLRGRLDITKRLGDVNRERILTVEERVERCEELEARVKKLEALVDEMVACQPSDPRGDLARAEKSFDEGAGKRKRTQREEKD